MEQFVNCVVSAETVKTFKTRLNNLWSDQEVLFDYKADLRAWYWEPYYCD